MRDNALVGVNQRETAGLDIFLLRQRQQNIEKPLVGFQHLYEFHQPAVGDIELAVKAVRARIRLGAVVADGGKINTSHHLGNILGLGVRRHKCANAAALFFGEKYPFDGDAIDIALVRFTQR